MRKPWHVMEKRETEEISVIHEVNVELFREMGYVTIERFSNQETANENAYHLQQMIEQIDTAYRNSKLGK